MNRTRAAGTRPALALAAFVVLMGVGAARADASTAGPSAATTPQIEQLDEILVRGRVTGNQIIDAEDKFFALYNKLNDNEKFRMTCGFRSVTAGSRLTVRACVPGFIASQVGFRQVNCATGSFANGDFYTSLGSCQVTGYEPPPAELLLMGYEAEMRRHMLQVIRSDPRLLDMADRLDALHREMVQIQSRYVQVREARRKPAKAGAAAGPRRM